MRSAVGGSAQPSHRRNSRAVDPLRKTGWQVHGSVADAVKQAVEGGAAESQNAFVERALVRELKELRRQRVHDAYAVAATDPVFMAEMNAVTDAFDATASDDLRPSRA